MKKSKIIIPALALLAFSTAASVTGAVAWFTANRTATIDAGTYTVVKTNANLEFELGDGIGTEVDTTDDHVINFNGLLTDGSVNHKTQKVYTPDSFGTGHAAAPKDEIDLNGTYPLTPGGETLEDLLTRGETDDTTPVTIYTAATFDITFTITFGQVPGDIGLYLDNTTGKSAFSVTGTPVTATGFRMAFLPKAASTNGRATVFADLQTASNCHYISSKTQAMLPGTDYESTDYDLIHSGYNAALPTTSTTRADAIARPDYLGYFAFQADTEVELSYTVVAWFEGTDPNVVNQDVIANYQTVASTLCFEAVNLNAAS